MARTYSQLTSGNTTTDGTSAVTASISPSADALLIAICVNSKTSTPNTLTPSGLSLTWNSITGINGVTGVSPRLRIEAWYAVCGSSPGSGTITFTASASQTGYAWSICEVTDADTGTPIVQNDSASADSSSSFTLNLEDAVGADPLVFAAYGIATTTTMTPEWTNLGTQSFTSPARTLIPCVSTSSDTSAQITLSAATDVIGIIFEVSKGGGGGSAGQPTAIRHNYRVGTLFQPRLLV